MKLDWKTIARHCCLVATGALLVACATLPATPRTGGDQASATPADALREALRVGTGRAVESLARVDGYLDNVDVRIPVPPKLDRVARGLRAIGAGFVVDEFVTSMNRAAEAAAPAAKAIFIDVVTEMTFSDARTILRGQAHEATDYLEQHSRARLAELFRPIVAERLDSAGTTRAFEKLTRETERLPFLARPAFDLEQFVTEAALDGLFFMVAREEERIRKDPLARTTDLLKRFFGDLLVRGGLLSEELAGLGATA